MFSAVQNRLQPIIALALGVCVIGAFLSSYYSSDSVQLPATPLSQLHGAVLAAWLVAIAVQARLTELRHFRVHRALGSAGTLLAAFVFATGIVATLVDAATPQPRALGLTAEQFAAIPLVGLTFFAVFVSGGIALRMQPPLQRRFTLLALAAVLGPSTTALVGALGLRAQYVEVQMAAVALAVGLCAIHDWMRYRVVHPAFLAAGAALIASWPLRVMLARSEMWQGFVGWATA